MIDAIKKSERKDIFRCSLFIGIAILAFIIIQYVISSVYFLYMFICGYGITEASRLILSDIYIGYGFNAIGSIVSFVPAFWLFGKLYTKRKLHEYICFSKPTGARLTAVCIIFGVGASMASNYISGIFRTVFGIIFGVVPEQVQVADGAVGSLPELGFTLLCAAVIPALVEEFAMRGVVLGMLRKFGDMPAILITAIIFGIIHGNFVQIPFAFCVGLVLGIITVVCNSIWPAVAVHFINNSLAMIFTYMSNYSLGLLLSYLIFYALIGAGIFAFVILLSDRSFRNIRKTPSTMSASERAGRMLLSPTLLIALALFLVTAAFSVEAL